MNKAAIPNPALQPLAVLTGTWNSTGTHPAVPDTLLHGRGTFAWIEGGAFLKWTAEVDHPEFPDGVAIFGSDDATERCFLLYFDERGVSRQYEVAIEGRTIRWWRNAPGMSQRYSWTISDDGEQIAGNGELSKDGTTWEPDLSLTYTRAR